MASSYPSFMKQISSPVPECLYKSNKSCLLQRSNTRSFLREAVEWSCPTQPTPAVFLSPHSVLNCGCARAEPLLCEVFGGTCVNWFPGSFYSRKHHWERGKWKIVRVKAVPKVVWRICELHKCTDLIIWHLDSCGLQLLWKLVIAAVRFYKNLEITA